MSNTFNLKQLEATTLLSYYQLPSLLDQFKHPLIGYIFALEYKAVFHVSMLLSMFYFIIRINIDIKIHQIFGSSQSLKFARSFPIFNSSMA